MAGRAAAIRARLDDAVRRGGTGHLQPVAIPAPTPVTPSCSCHLSPRKDGPGLLLLLLLCQEIDGVSGSPLSGAGVRRRFQTRRAMWRLRQRIASRLVLPLACSPGSC